MDIPANAHVLVIDGGRMLMLVNEGSAAEPSLAPVEQREQTGPDVVDRQNEQPGTSFQSFSPGRSSYEQTDLKQLDEDRFAADAADHLKREVLAGRMDAVIIVAAPRTLGELRKAYHTEVQKRVVGEIAKVMTGHPTEEILAAIAAA
ncbi:host attachment family protein [Sandarakinorhabdus sp.]|uniref:host attachment family protein n=1 Tax=Sandarakinorhabdus sp. TaxID=1916663 RepID=UPI003F7088B8